MLSLYAFRASRTEEYRTGEQHSEITRALSRDIPDGAPLPRFVDVTEAAGLSGFRTFAGERTSQLPEDMGPGAAWGDFDGDGDDDLFLVSAGGPLTAAENDLAPSELFENLGDGTFARVEEFPETRIVGMSAAWGDHDGDGDLDLVVTGYDTLRLFRNDSGHFERDDEFASPQGYWAGASWSDFDRDGDLDLYICGYVQYVPDVSGKDRISSQYGRQIPYTLNPSSYKPERNLLFVNRGDGTFDEQAESRGVSNPDGRSLVALWHDLDDDGWPDLYVANDISDNALYLNREGRFEDASHAAWVADYRGAMGLAAGDWNRDGDDDLFVTHWVAQENALYDSRFVDDAGLESAEGAPLRFVDFADQRGLGQIALRSVGWGAEFFDFDADGWLDLAVANGSTFEEQTVPRHLTPELPFLFWNDHGRFFHDLAPLSDPFAVPRVARGLALADYDNDGDIDVLLIDGDGGGVRLLRNETEQGNWVQLSLRARVENGYGPAEGARVVAVAGDVAHRRAVSGVSYLSQSSRRLHVGLGPDRLESVEVHWPGGSVQHVTGLTGRSIWEIREGEPEPRLLAAPRPPLTREQVSEFWNVQRAAVHAMKAEEDLVTAIDLFHRALEIDPTHEDSIYYLGNCLAERGELDAALRRFEALMRLNRSSHRAFKRWGTLRAMSATSSVALKEAEEALARAVEINPEATGARMVLAETKIVQGDLEAARQSLRWIHGTNPSAGDALFLLAYLDWRQGDSRGARDLLRRAAETGEDWRPEGAAAEGDVKRTMHRETTLFAGIYASWDRSTDPGPAFAALEESVRGYRRF
ncbi:MAG: tetratricopeptide repeat protein [Acidobacteria bacterium]|nr:tetratricopeptide repeat protein [Acidobacteriota bacterium]NIQ28820.1 tetratricopeptide repeat protein [Acidobacteriota bacterium]NIQ83278.1 tetratricopeptide repeat protein [Acidobacteriota bacterium]